MSKKAKKQKKGVGRKKKKTGAAGWIFWAVLTTLNLLISIALRISDRKKVIAAVQQDERFSVLYSGEKSTKTL